MCMCCEHKSKCAFALIFCDSIFHTRRKSMKCVKCAQYVRLKVSSHCGILAIFKKKWSINGNRLFSLSPMIFFLIILLLVRISGVSQDWRCRLCTLCIYQQHQNQQHRPKNFAVIWNFILCWTSSTVVHLTHQIRTNLCRRLAHTNRSTYIYTLKTCVCHLSVCINICQRNNDKKTTTQCD